MMIDIAMIVCILYESIAMELAAGGVNQKSDGNRFMTRFSSFHLAIQRLIGGGPEQDATRIALVILFYLVARSLPCL